MNSNVFLLYEGYCFRHRRIIEKINKAQEDNKFIELHAHVFINVACLKQIFYFIISRFDTQFLETVLEFLLIYFTIGIFICINSKLQCQNI